MESRNRGWRPPANATTFSFGPWVTCHCAHGVAEEPEVRIADEVRHGPPKLRMKAQDFDAKPEVKKPQLPEAALPDREDRKSAREEVGKAKSPKRVQLPALPATPSRGKKVLVALTLLVLAGLALGCAGYLKATRLYNDLEEHRCRVSKIKSETAMTPQISCLAQLEVLKPCDKGNCWSPMPEALQHQGWTWVTFENPKEFLGVKSCASEAKHHAPSFQCFFSSKDAQLGVLAQRSRGELDLIVACRYRLVIISWALAFLCLSFGTGLCLPSRASFIRLLQLFRKAIALTLVASALAGLLVLAWRYPHAEELHQQLQDGHCELHGATKVSSVSTWSLLPAAECAVQLEATKAQSLIFAYPKGWFQLKYHHLDCEELLKSLRPGFPCAVAGTTAVLGHKAELPVLFLELSRLQFQDPLALDFFCFSLLASLLMMLQSLLGCRRRQTPEGYQRLAGDAK